MTEEKIVEREVRRINSENWKSTVLIILLRSKGREPEGEIFNIHIPEKIPFRGYGDLMLKMDRIYDLLEAPVNDSGRKWKDWNKWQGTALETDADWIYGMNASTRYRECAGTGCSLIYVETKFRRHGSWQGILWAGEEKKMFESALEFLHYCSDALERKITGEN